MPPDRKSRQATWPNIKSGLDGLPWRSMLRRVVTRGGGPARPRWSPSSHLPLGKSDTASIRQVNGKYWASDLAPPTKKAWPSWSGYLLRSNIHPSAKRILFQPDGRSPGFWLLTNLPAFPASCGGPVAYLSVWVSSCQSQWRDHAGITPASLFSPYWGHLQTRFNC